MENYTQIYNAFLDYDGFQLESKAESALQQVKLPASVWNDSFDKLSGGQKTRAQLARLILKKRFKAKEAELERLEKNKVQKPQSDKNVNLTLDGASFSARRLLQIENLSFSFKGEQMLFSGLNTSIYRGDRIGVIGPNGSGKSTLLKLIAGKLTPESGDIKLNPQTSIGYFAQELENLDEHSTILDSILELPGMTQSEARTILGCFLFPQETVFKQISSLSMGEKCRVAFILLYFSSANLLVLDEPTNFLDVDTKEVIEDVLQAYPGALIIVSHDRYLIQKTANRVLELGNGQVLDYEGNYGQFMEHKKRKANYNPDTENDVQELELRLTQLMSMETTIDEEQQSILNEIGIIQQKLLRLRR